MQPSLTNTNISVSRPLEMALPRQEIFAQSNDEKENKTTPNPDNTEKYSAQDIYTLLKAFGISELTEAKLSCDEKAEFDTYVNLPCAFTEDFIIRDHIQYFLTHGTKARSRHAAFLFEDSNKVFGLSVRFSKLDQNRSKELFQFLQKHSLDTVEKVLVHSDLVLLFSRLYSNTEFLFLSPKETSDLIVKIRASIQKSCKGKAHLKCLILPPDHTNLALTEYLFSMLTQDQVKDLEHYIVVQNYHGERLLDAFLMGLKKLAPDQEQEITLRLIVNSKYKFLKAARQQYVLQDDSLDSLEAYLECDRHTKLAIYGNREIDAKKALSYLPIKGLIQLFNLLEDPKQLLDFLKNKQKGIFKELKTWEETLTEKCKREKSKLLPYLLHQAKKTGRFIYHHSLMQLGGELIPWLLRPLSRKIPATNLANKMKGAFQKAVAWGTRQLTGSVLQAANNAHLAGVALQDDNILWMCGTGIGLASHCLLGGYTLVRMLAVSLLIQQINQHLYQHTDDVKAVVVSRANKILDAKHVSTLASLITSLTEVIYTGDYRHFMAFTGGMTGSWTAVKIFQLTKPQLPVPTLTSTADEANQLFLASLIGHDLGYALTMWGQNLLENILQKATERQEVITYFKKTIHGGIDEIQLEFPDSLIASKQNQTVNIEWHNNRNGFFYRATCSLSRETLFNYQEQYLLNCDPATQMISRLTNS